MSIQTIRESLGDFAKDIKINLGNLLGEGGRQSFQTLRRASLPSHAPMLLAINN